MVGESPAPEALPDAELAREQALALRRLDQLLDALKDADDDPRPLSRGGGGGDGGDEGGGGGPQGDDSLPPPAQLKLLRALEKEIYDRTEAFRKKHPDLDNLGAKDRAELQDLHREQKEVADLLGRLVRPPDEDPAGADPDKPEKDAKEGEEKP
jgi:hypothetical protein